MYYVYILKSILHNKFYIGQTNNLHCRFKLHNSKKVKSTAPYCPWILIGHLSKDSRSASIILERKLKNLNREDLIKFIDKYFRKKYVESLKSNDSKNNSSF